MVKANAETDETDALGMTGPLYRFSHAMPCHAQGGQQASGSNTQHDDSAIDYLCSHDSRARPRADDNLHCPED